MTDVYKAPAGDLSGSSQPGLVLGSLQKGIAGEYDFSISAVLAEAWEKTDGSKGKIWIAFALYLAVFIPMTLCLHIFLGDDWFGDGLRVVVMRCVDVSLSAGISMLGVKLAVGAPVESNEVYQHIEKAVQFVVAAILMAAMVAAGTILLVLPGIYLFFSYLLVTMLIAEKKLQPWQALEASRKALTHHWFKIFFLAVAYAVIVLVSALPAGIGLIWTLPMGAIIRGIVYRTVFGYEASTEGAPLQPKLS
ncbi:MAG TPA: hypothetical protein VIF60_17100 [Burkholderiaceae bacterium]|jgi:hypothetical protein